MVFSMAFSMTGCGGSDAEATWADQYAVYLEDADGYDNENYEALKAAGLVKKQLDGVKVLGRGALEKKLTVKAEKFSKSAVEKIEKAGGKAEVI